MALRGLIPWPIPAGVAIASMCYVRKRLISQCRPRASGDPVLTGRAV